MIPRWFLVLLAACAVLLTGSVLLHLRWQPRGQGYLDTWTSRVCLPEGCQPLGESFASRVDRIYDEP